MDINEVCQICRHQNDQMLMLACVHDPCINCAASAYAQLVYIKNSNPNIYVCEICSQETALDSSTVAELNSLSQSFVKVASPSRGHQTKAVGRSSSLEKSKNQPEKSPMKKTTYFCKIHSEQELTYYCFTCHENICPQCAIHGSHKDHEVKLIKKAINQIKSQFLDVVSQIGSAQNGMMKFKDSFKRSIKEANERNEREKSLVSQQFQLLRNTFTNKERQILKELDSNHKQNVMVLTNFVEQIDKVYEEIEKSKKEIQNILKKEEVLIFEEYKSIPKLEEKAHELKKISEDISGEIILLNTEFLQQELKAIQQSIKKFKPTSKKEAISAQANGKGQQHS